jgi:amphiphysin
MSPIGGEYDLLGKYPDAEHTIRSIDKYEAMMVDLRQAVTPELELIETRIVAPLKDYQSVLKTIRKTITKREHKVSAGALKSISCQLTVYS